MNTKTFLRARRKRFRSSEYPIKSVVLCGYGAWTKRVSAAAPHTVTAPVRHPPQIGADTPEFYRRAGPDHRVRSAACHPAPRPQPIRCDATSPGIFVARTGDSVRSCTNLYADVHPWSFLSVPITAGSNHNGPGLGLHLGCNMLMTKEMCRSLGGLGPAARENCSHFCYLA